MEKVGVRACVLPLLTSLRSRPSPPLPKKGRRSFARPASQPAISTWIRNLHHTSRNATLVMRDRKKMNDTEARKYFTFAWKALGASACCRGTILRTPSGTLNGATGERRRVAKQSFFVCVIQEKTERYDDAQRGAVPRTEQEVGHALFVPRKASHNRGQCSRTRVETVDGGAGCMGQNPWRQPIQVPHARPLLGSYRGDAKIFCPLFFTHGCSQ